MGPKIAAAFGSTSTMLYIRNGFGGKLEELTVTPNRAAELRAGYESYHHQHDIWAESCMKLPNGAAMTSQDVISEKAFREAPIYWNHAGHARCLHVLGALVPIGGPGRAFGVFGVHRDEAEGAFAAEDRAQGLVFLPHLKRALQLREKLAALEIQKNSMGQAAEMMQIGIMLVASDRKIIFANPLAEMLLEHPRGLHERNNRLFATSPATDAALRRHIENAAQASIGHAKDAGGLLQVSGDGAKPLTLSIYPFAAPHLPDGRKVAAALLFVGDPGLIEPARRDVLAQLYRLTAAEARLFEALLGGMRLQEYAEQSSLSRDTVKTQLARLFDKTGHARQTELVRDALTNPILNLKSR